MTFLPLPLDAWRPTRDGLQAISLLLSRIRSLSTPPLPHLWHISLHPCAAGLTTTRLPTEPGVELILDLRDPRLSLAWEGGANESVPIVDRPLRAICTDCLDRLSARGIEPPIERERFNATEPLAIEPPEAGRYLDALSGLAFGLRTHRSYLANAATNGVASPVQLWAHHFDLALLWLTGGRVPGVAAEDRERGDEQLNLGFSTGDDTIGEPYLYATAYPEPDRLAEALEVELSGDARVADGIVRWQRDGFSGAVLPYSALVDAEDPLAVMTGFLGSFHRAFAAAQATGGATGQPPDSTGQTG